MRRLRHWVAYQPGFFLPVRVLSRLFRRLFLQALQNAFNAGKLRFFGNLSVLAKPEAFTQRLGQLRRIDWVVFAKPPFGGPEQVLAYLARYTHRVAIANSRLISLSNGKVRFTWKDYRQSSKSKLMTLDADEFIRRFLLHALPDGFRLSATTASSPTAGAATASPSAANCSTPATLRPTPNPLPIIPKPSAPNAAAPCAGPLPCRPRASPASRFTVTRHDIATAGHRRRHRPQHAR
jgi:Putative transposase